MSMVKSESSAQAVRHTVALGVSAILGDTTSMFQLIQGDGSFNGNELNSFAKKVKLAEFGLRYSVVSIIGPQSSGKSTLINHLFRTDFKEMNASNGLSQTTQGVWIAAVADTEHCTLVIDIEGSDGTERGEDGKLFQRQSAIFALVVSNVLIINIHTKEIGRVCGWTDLLKTIFEEITTLKIQGTTTLLFAGRDRPPYPRTVILERDLLKQITEIFTTVSKSRGHEDASLYTFFKVEFRFLPNFEINHDMFKEEVSCLRDHLLGVYLPANIFVQKERNPASEFPAFAEKSWEVIQKNKDLDIPSIQKLASLHRCRELKNEIAESFCQNKDLERLEKAVSSGPVIDFGERLKAIISQALSDFDEKAKFNDEGVRNEMRLELIGDLQKLRCTRRVMISMLKHLYKKVAEDFKYYFGQFHSNLSEDSLNAVVDDCRRELTESFERRRQVLENEYVQYDLSEFHDRLNSEIDHCIDLVSCTRAVVHSREACVAADREAAEATAEAAKLAEEATIAYEACRGNNDMLARRIYDEAQLSADQAALRSVLLQDKAKKAHANAESDEGALKKFLIKTIGLGLSAGLTVFGIYAAGTISGEMGIQAIIALLIEGYAKLVATR